MVRFDLMTLQPAAEGKAHGPFPLGTAMRLCLCYVTGGGTGLLGKAMRIDQMGERNNICIPETLKYSSAKTMAPRRNKASTQKTAQEWHPSDRAINYTIDENSRYDLKGKLGVLIANSYLECEKKVIDDYNTDVRDNFRIIPCAFFELGLQGSVENALLLTCALNSGFCDEVDAAKKGMPCDIDAYADTKLQRIIQGIRTGKIHGQPHIALLKEVWALPNGRRYPFVDWWRNNATGKAHHRRQWLLDVIKELHGDKTEDEAFHGLAYHLASRDLLYYHTKEGGGLGRWKKSCKKILDKELSPHQELVIADIKQAIRLRVPIFISRAIGTWMKYVGELKKYDLLFCSSSARGKASISSNNLLLYDDKVKKDCSVEAKARAWKKFTEALQKRYKELGL